MPKLQRWLQIGTLLSLSICFMDSFIPAQAFQLDQRTLNTQVIQDSQRLNDLEERIRDSTARLAVVEKAVANFDERMSEATWMLRGIVIAFATEILRRGIAKSQPPKDEDK